MFGVVFVSIFYVILLVFCVLTPYMVGYGVAFAYRSDRVMGLGGKFP